MRAPFFVLLFAAVLTTASAEESSCDSATDRRELIGPGPLTEKLHVEATSQNLLFNNGEFHDERFSYIGAVRTVGGAAWHVALVVTTWGQSCRATSRLLIFDRDLHFKGQYSHFQVRRFRVEGASILIADAEQEDGNRIDFDDHGPPETAHFDGDNYELYGAQ